ncbi:MarR family winged helix-turn-helix transcriptional regulator [Streptomyces sp.]|uniref:MarR family winged helix-turn-helix transcriptional regulator n=1 Tax=Streptomyces sp. TaxID=1931 RepID=UPI002F411EA8
MASSTDSLHSAMRLGNQIKQCEQALVGEKHRVLRPFGLTVPQYAALLAVWESPQISGAQLARRCGVTAQAMNGVVALLEDRGLITRSHSADHAKVLLIRLTRSGRNLLRQADQAAIAVERRLMQAFTDSELDSLRVLLDTAIGALAAERPGAVPVRHAAAS